MRSAICISIFGSKRLAQQWFILVSKVDRHSRAMCAQSRPSTGVMVQVIRFCCLRFKCKVDNTDTLTWHPRSQKKNHHLHRKKDVFIVIVIGPWVTANIWTLNSVFLTQSYDRSSCLFHPFRYISPVFQPLFALLLVGRALSCKYLKLEVVACPPYFSPKLWNNSSLD